MGESFAETIRSNQVVTTTEKTYKVEDRMNAILVLIGIGLLGAFAYIHEKRWYSPIVFICIEWFLIVFFSEYGGLGYYPSSGYALLMVFMGVLSFVVGGLFVRKKKQNQRVYETTKELSSIVEENKYLIYALLAIATLYCVWKMSQIGLNVLRMRSAFAVYRLSWLDGGAFANAREEFVYNNIILPSVYLNIIIACIDFSVGKTNKLQTIITILCVGLIVIFSGGRMILMDLAVMLVIAMILNKRRLNLKKLRKQRKYLILALIVVLLLLNKISMDRQALNLLQVAMGNFSLSLPLLSHTISMAASNGDITYGVIFVRGVLDLFLSVLSFLGIDAWPNAYQTLSKYTTPFFVIGEGIRANAYTTSFFYFYLDARWVGVILFSGIFGYFSETLYRNALRDKQQGNTDQYNTALFLLGFSVVLRTFYNYSYSRLTYIIIFILIYFAINPKRVHFRIRGNRSK